MICHKDVRYCTGLSMAAPCTGQLSNLDVAFNDDDCQWHPATTPPLSHAAALGTFRPQRSSSLIQLALHHQPPARPHRSTHHGSNTFVFPHDTAHYRLTHRRTASQFMEDMQKRSNCTSTACVFTPLSDFDELVTSAELERLKKRFMKLDRYGSNTS